jgi:hypothetical protein
LLLQRGSLWEASIKHAAVGTLDFDTGKVLAELNYNSVRERPITIRHAVAADDLARTDTSWRAA